MYLDRVPRLISYHDTWMSIDPIHGCPYHCAYCVLRYGDKVGVRPQVIASPEETLKQLTQHPFFRPGKTPLAIGTETDMFHPFNRDYLINLLSMFQTGGITNPISLITKAPIQNETLEKIHELDHLRVILYLSYSGLGNTYEPGFRDEDFRANFSKVKHWGFPIIHYWRPLLPENTTPDAIVHMLEFVSSISNASAITGLKLHPELNKILSAGKIIPIPEQYKQRTGEWLDDSVLDRIHATAKKICPNYPIYRHGSCSLAYVLAQPNHTATVYQTDICLPSQCPAAQRKICMNQRNIPKRQTVQSALRSIGRDSTFNYEEGAIFIDNRFTQEEFIYLLHSLIYPLKVRQIEYQNIYRGTIFADQPGADNIRKTQ